MTQKTPLKRCLPRSNETHRSTCQTTDHSTITFTTKQNNIGINTEKLDGNVTEEIPEMSIQVERSETYWKLVTEQRQQAIQETMIENQRLHSLINDLSKQNDKLTSYCDSSNLRY